VVFHWREERSSPARSRRFRAGTLVSMGFEGYSQSLDPESMYAKGRASMEGSRALRWALLLVRLNFSGFTIKFETESPTSGQLR